MCAMIFLILLGHICLFMSWLEKDLVASKKPFKFVSAHGPIYSDYRGPYTLEKAKKKFSRSSAMWKLFEKHKVTAYLCGHSHKYAVIQPKGGKPIEEEADVMQSSGNAKIKVIIEPDKLDPQKIMLSMEMPEALAEKNVTGLIDRLERDGLVERRELKGDRRAKVIFLTRAGNERLDLGEKPYLKAIQAIGKEVDDSERKQTILVLQRVCGAVSEFVEGAYKEK